MEYDLIRSDDLMEGDFITPLDRTSCLFEFRTERQKERYKVLLMHPDRRFVTETDEGIMLFSTPDLLSGYFKCERIDRISNKELKHPLIGDHWNKPPIERYKGCDIREGGGRFFVFGMGYDTIDIARETIDKAFKNLSHNLVKP